MIAFERLAVLDGKPLNYTLLGATLLLFVSGLVGWPVGALRARRQRPPDAPPRPARLLAWLACGLNVAFVTVLSDPSEIAFGVPGKVRLLLALPLAGAAAAAVTLG